MMPKRFAWVAAGAAACVALSLALAGPGPEPAPKGASQWEYCELNYRAAAARGGFGGKGGFGGGPGGAGGLPGGAAPAAKARVAAQLFTEDETIEATDWEELATKLKAPPAKKGATVATHRLRVLNQLGRQGWELMPSPGLELRASSTYLFKRRITK